MDMTQFLIAALRDGGRIEIHGPGSSEADEHGEEENEDGEGSEEGEPETGPEGSEEADERATGYNRASPTATPPDSVRAALMRAAG